MDQLRDLHAHRCIDNGMMALDCILSCSLLFLVCALGFLFLFFFFYIFSFLCVVFLCGSSNILLGSRVYVDCDTLGIILIVVKHMRASLSILSLSNSEYWWQLVRISKDAFVFIAQYLGSIS